MSFPVHGGMIFSASHGDKPHYLTFFQKFMENYYDYKKCIDACLACAVICNHCASSCLQEKDMQL